jgi:hypothetical protein
MSSVSTSSKSRTGSTDPFSWGTVWSANRRNTCAKASTTRRLAMEPTSRRVSLEIDGVDIFHRRVRNLGRLEQPGKRLHSLVGHFGHAGSSGRGTDPGFVVNSGQQMYLVPIGAEVLLREMPTRILDALCARDHMCDLRGSTFMLSEGAPS